MPYVGEIRIFGGNFAPIGWMFCSGQTLPISENDTLFQLIGTTYGGDGQETFCLPDLRGRVPIHMGASDYNVTYQIGQWSGTESVTLNTSQIPSHTHNAQGSINIPVRGDSSGNLSSPVNNAIGIGPAKQFFSKTQSTNGVMAPLTITANTSSTGGSQPHENMQPFLAVSFIISLFGVFPSQ